MNTVDPEGRDDLEPTSLPFGRLLLVPVATVVLGIAAAALLWGAYQFRIGHVAALRPARFPAPQLEVNQTPALSVAAEHGPKPYRSTPAPARRAEQPGLDDPVARAMAALASQGARAYEPPAPTATAGS